MGKKNVKIGMALHQRFWLIVVMAHRKERLIMSDELWLWLRLLFDTRVREEGMTYSLTG